MSARKKVWRLKAFHEDVWLQSKMHDFWEGAADRRRKHDGDAQSHAYSAPQLRTDAVAARCYWVRDSRTPSCYSTNAPLHARSASTCHATQMKSDIRILTGFSLSISGFWKNLILTSLLHTPRSSTNRMNHTCFCLSSRSWYSFTVPTLEGWKAELALGGWLHTKISGTRIGELNPDTVAISVQTGPDVD